MNIKVEHNTEQFIKELMEDTERYKRDLKKAVFRSLTLLEAEIKQNIRKGAGLNVRTGALRNSIYKKIFESDSGYVYGEVGSEGVPYARIHELGGTVKPVNAKYLTIPHPDNRRADGLPKITIQDLFGFLKKQMFIHKNVIFLQTGRKGKKFTEIRPMFFLKKSVDIPARPYLSTAVASKKDQILKEFGLFLKMSFGIKG